MINKPYVFYGELTKGKDGRKIGKFYKRKDGDWDLVLPLNSKIGFTIGNVVKFELLEQGRLRLSVYEPFKKKEENSRAVNKKT